MDPLELIKTQAWSPPKIKGSNLIKYTHACVWAPTEGQVEKSIHESAVKEYVRQDLVGCRVKNAYHQLGRCIWRTDSLP